MFHPKEMHMQRRMPLAAAASALALSSSMALVSAQTLVAEVPEPQRFGNVSVINGGTDLDEAERLRRMSPQYPLSVVFSVRGGDYAVADEFVIRRDGQPVAEVSNAGPWLLVDLPPGRYSLQADFQGRVVERPFTVSRNGGGSTVHWVAPASVQ
jgi:hypothetical protein